MLKACSLCHCDEAGCDGATWAEMAEEASMMMTPTLTRSTTINDDQDWGENEQMVKKMVVRNVFKLLSLGLAA
jgi:hypothetical protein